MVGRIRAEARANYLRAMPATAASIRRDKQEGNRPSWDVIRGKKMHVTVFESQLFS